MGNKKSRLDAESEAKLINAITKGDAAAVAQLIATGIDVNAALKAEHDETPLELAVRSGESSVAEVLFKAGADWRQAGLNLVWTVYRKNEWLTRKLIEAGADLNFKGRRLERPLALATSYNLPNLMRLLIDAGADVNADEPITKAVTANFSEAALMLLKAAAKPVKDAGLVPWAAQRGNGEVLRALIQSGADINEKAKLSEYDDEKSEHVTYYELAPALIVAAGNGAKEIVEVLIAAGADLYATDAKGATAIDYAKQRHHPQVVSLLEAASAKTPRKADPSAGLIFASDKGDTGEVKNLLSSGANPNTRDDRPKTLGFTPLMLAARQGHHEVIAVLLESGADAALVDEGKTGDDAGFNFIFKEGGVGNVLAAGFSMTRTALHWAAEEGHIESARLLIPRTKDVSLLDRAKLTPLHLAASAGAVEIIRDLLKAGADVGAKGRGKQLALHYAARNGSVEAVRALLEAGAKVDLKNDDGETPLHIAASRAHPDAVAALLKAGADFNAFCKSGSNVIACAIGHQLFEQKYQNKQIVTVCLRPEADVLETVRLLIEAGSDPSAKEKQAFTALDRVNRYLKDSPLFPSLADLLGKAQPRTAAPAPVVKKSTPKEPANTVKPEGVKKEHGNVARADFSAAAKRPEFEATLTELEKLCGTKRQLLNHVDGGFTLHVQSGKKFDLEKAQAEFLKKGAFVFSPDMDFDSRIGVLPTTDKYDALLAMQTNGQNYDLMPQDVVDWLQKLDIEQPFVLTGAGFDFVRGKFSAKIAKPGGLAKRMYEFCPDIVDQGVGDVKALAEELRKSSAFFFWWD